MIGDMVRYAVHRALGGAIETAMRKAFWIGIAIFLIIVGAVFSLIVAFWLLYTHLGVTVAASAIAIGGFVLGLACLMVPRLSERTDTESKEADLVAETIASVRDEASAAVDYFGPIRVLGSAFLLGLSIAKKFRSAFGYKMR